ncbi:MAG: S8 family serine peptidase [Calothrix sp. C42_A2020_038]|nr:S8 family serine peptidase [Calothrix sp. C42_A2020_038]
MQLNNYSSPLYAAQNLYLNSNVQICTNWVGPYKVDDFYRLKLNSHSSLSISLTGIYADVDVELVQDLNANNIFDGKSEVIIGSYSSGTQHESIQTTLNPGAYYIRVYFPTSASFNQFSYGTNYQLHISSQSITQNSAPTWLQFNLDNTTLQTNDALNINGGYVYDNDGAGDIARVDFRIQRADGSFVDIPDATNFTSSTWSQNWAEFNYKLALNNLNLTSGNYKLWATAYDKAGATSDAAERSFSYTQYTPPSSLQFDAFNISDASSDNTADTVFQSGAIRFSYALQDSTSLSNIRLEALKDGNIISIGTWNEANLSLSNLLIDLSDINLTGGEYQFRAVARTTSGEDFFSTTQPLKILSWQPANTIYGSYTADKFDYSAPLGTGSVFIGRGGTDVLNLGIDRSSVTSINGTKLANFNPLSSIKNQAIFRGTAFDYLTLADGREIYFQGIESLSFSDGSILELQVRTNDTYYSQQWNLHLTDVNSAWRFTQGSSNVLLVSLDTGITNISNNNTEVFNNRLITNLTSYDHFNDYGHGHSSISIMSSTPNNGLGIAGINWNSNVYVNNIYTGVNFQQAIRDSINYARTNNMRVVFQAGIQGEYWLNNGGTQAQLEQLIQENSDIAIFAVAAGNGSRDIDDTFIYQQDLNNYPGTTVAVYSSGVSRLQTTHNNVIAVGALTHTGTITVNGLTNATSVDRAWYSNYGKNLTLFAPTDSPAIDSYNQMHTFSGTSSANPNMAGIASLVWSVNPNLTPAQIRQILIDTATDLGVPGQDRDFGNGLVNADAAVRRAFAISENSQLANLYSGRFQFA